MNEHTDIPMEWHAIDGFRPRRNREDDLLDRVRGAISRAEGRCEDGEDEKYRKCDECKKNNVMHSVFKDGVRKYICCRCYVMGGAAPADWHRDCMKAYRELQEGHTMR